MKLEIHWQGLYGSGLFLHMVEGMQNLLRTRIYLRIKSYSGGRTVTYVGPSNQFLEGINQHIAGGAPGLTLGSNDESGQMLFTPAFDAHIRALNDTENITKLALAEAQRMRFYYALCDL